MADGTKIEWTDATVNAVNGCSVVSPGCTHCYAMRLAGTRMKDHPSRAGLTVETKAGPVWTGEVRLNKLAMVAPLGWRRPHRIFWNAHGDAFHPKVPRWWIDHMMAICAATPQHIHQILTKRADRMRAYFTDPAWRDRVSAVVNSWSDDDVKAGNDFTADIRLLAGDPLPNVWLGVSVEDQARRSRLLDLAATPAAIRFVSGEPLLEGVTLHDVPIETDEDGRQWLFNALTGEQYFVDDLGYVSGDGPDLGPLDWVIVGGESGPGARPMHPSWPRELRDQCRVDGVPFFFKQWGDWAPVCAIDLDALDEKLFHAPRVVEGSRRCKVEQCILWSNGRRFDVNEWSAVIGEEPLAGRFAHAAGSGSMLTMRVGKRTAGRLLDGVQHDGMPA